MAPIASDLPAEQREQLCGLLGNVDLTLLYKASVHGYEASAFHQRCDNQGATLLVAYNNSGDIFGGYTSVDYTQSGKEIADKEAFLFSFRSGNLLCIKVKSGYNARCDDAGMPNFGQQLYFCYNNQPVVIYQHKDCYRQFIFNPDTLYGNNNQLTECEVYQIKQTLQVSFKEKPWRNILWTAERREELMGFFRSHKPLLSSVNRVRILMLGPVGAGKSSFFNSINSIFMGYVTSKAMSGSAKSSVTTQFRMYPVKDGHERKPLPFVLCDTMGLEEQSGAGLDIKDISSILQGHIPDRYRFNPVTPFQPDEQKSSRPASLLEKIHCVVYVIDATKISLMSEKLEEKLTSVRCLINSLAIPQMVVMTKVDEACPHVQKDLQNVYASSYTKMKVQEVSSRLGVPVSCVLPVKNYSQEIELDLNCDVLLLSALHQMLRLADDYLDDVDSF
ncbi:interferon-induced protein 44-like isoform X1 [Danio rerio]|uniref:Interferon-induced protein 44-like isoform X1 n=7 Tax=Danio rerio TaxID=7955 RepID=A0AC58IF90_DANRE|nr:interferon-induced protein 44-like isoform X1 [Danio rerio]|eukprot:XP_003201084.1 interferon-induced protein 44-like isoform X1 [Danio rerio]